MGPWAGGVWPQGEGQGPQKVASPRRSALLQRRRCGNADDGGLVVLARGYRRRAWRYASERKSHAGSHRRGTTPTLDVSTALRLVLVWHDRSEDPLRNATCH